MSCPTGTVWNPITKRCNTITSTEGKLIQAVLNSKQDLFDRKGFVRNPVSGSYLPDDHPYASLVRKVIETDGEIICDEGMIFNQETGRCVKSIGGKFTCLNYPKKGNYIPRQYQVDLANYFAQTKEKGILLSHSLGSGKTCTTIGMIDEYLKKNDVPVYIFTPGSLRDNFLFQYCSVCGSDPQVIENKFKFITYNYSLILKSLPSLEELHGALVIVDEAHNVVRGFMNQSANYVAIYTLLYRANAKIILLTGTPVYGNIMSFYHLLHLITRSAFINSEDFRAQFNILDGIYHVKDKNNFYNRISPVISSYRASQNLEDFPQVITKMITVPMTIEQYQVFQDHRRKENIIRSNPPDPRLAQSNPAEYARQKTRYYLALVMQRSRQAGNLLYPERLGSLNEIPPDFFFDEGGWITGEDVDNLAEISPKSIDLVNNIVNNPGKHMVYSEFKTHFGIYFIQALLEYFGISTLLFTGDLNDKERGNVISSMNDPINNLYGEKYRVLLGTSALSEGINVLHLRGIHILEQDIDEFGISQVIGRGVRFQSHTALQKNERNITVYRYFATAPGEESTFEQVPKEKQSSDFVAYQVGTMRLVQLTPFIDFLNTFPVIPRKN